MGRVMARDTARMCKCKRYSLSGERHALSNPSDTQDPAPTAGGRRCRCRGYYELVVVLWVIVRHSFTHPLIHECILSKREAGTMPSKTVWARDDEHWHRQQKIVEQECHPNQRPIGSIFPPGEETCTSLVEWRNT